MKNHTLKRIPTLCFIVLMLAYYGYAQQYNYGEVLQKSLFFYEAQQSGQLPDWNRVSWRGDSNVNDATTEGEDVSGGWHDAGDHIKFGFPMAFSVTALNWGYLEYTEAYTNTGQDQIFKNNIRWVTDYLMKCHTGPNEFVAQVSDKTTDHRLWAAAELTELFTDRQAYKITANQPGTEVACETAAALASASMVFQDSDPAYSQELLQHARELYDFGDQYRGFYTEAIPAGCCYPSGNYYDELVWGALWLYKATGEIEYLQKAEAEYDNMLNNPNGQNVDFLWSLVWEDKSYGSFVLLSMLTDNPRYKLDAERHLDFWTNQITYSPGGQAWLFQWGSLRHSANAALTAFIYADNVVTPNRDQYIQFAEGQINYMLGDNPGNRSYVIGFGNNPPRNPHHRSNHGSWEDSDSGDPVPSSHTLYGALVGGPGAADDQHVDITSDFQENEVAVDYNACFQGAIARMQSEYGGAALSNFPVDEVPNRTEIFSNSKLNSSNSTSVTVSMDVSNYSAWPARAIMGPSVRYYMDISESVAAGYSINDYTISMAFAEGGATFSGPFPVNGLENNYYVQIDWNESVILAPAGYNHNAKEAQIQILVGNGVPFSINNDWSGNGLTDTVQQIDNIPIYDNGILVGGNEPDGSITTPTYTISASSGNGGSISPDGNVSVIEGGNQTFSISANTGFIISDVLVDNTSIGAVETYSFTNVTANATISVSFEAETVGNQSPTAVASATPVSGTAPLTVNFDASNSSDPDQDPLSYSWNFGDGNSATGITATHTYTTVGNFNAVVTVSDGQGNQDTDAVSITSTSGDTGGGDPCDGNYLSASGNELIDSSGNVVRLTGINWFGFETSNRAPHGLWSRDCKSMLIQIKDLGFNSVRIPWANAILEPGATMSGISTAPTPDAYTGRPLNEVEGTLTDPLDLLDLIIDYCQELNLKVILDNHSRQPDGYLSEELWYTDQTPNDKWIEDWVFLADRYKDKDAVIAMDINNEPHGKNGGGSRWGSGDVTNDWRLAAQFCGDAILAVNPNVLIMVEGVEEFENETYWWGGNLKGAAQYPVVLSDPSKLVYSPHEYGPTVFNQTWFSDPTFPSNMPQIWEDNFNYLHTQNVSPMYAGEFGIRDQGGVDEVWFDTYLEFMGQKGYSWSYWCWNPNSGDTGGILANDWSSINQWKMDKLIPHLAPEIPNTSTQNGNCNTTSYTITANAENGGSISPTGAVIVAEGENQSFTITADAGFSITDVVVDGTSVGAVANYTFSNVTTSHTITASFTQDEANTYTIIASANNGGSISPNGSVTVTEGDNQTFTINADAGFSITDVVVDGTSVGAVANYTFSNVVTNHTITAIFTQNEANTYTIVASAGNGGSISPNGTLTVTEGDNQTFAISADTGFSITDVVVDGTSVGAVANYTFSNITTSHTISASFMQDEPDTFEIRSSAGTGGSITPNGQTFVAGRSDQLYVIIPDTNFDILDVVVDGVSVGAVGNYTFTDVNSNHTIDAFFESNIPTNQDPTAVITTNTTSGIAPLAVSFSAENSSDPDGDTLTYNWSFGDNSTDANGLTVTNTYTEIGTYTAILTVSDGNGGSAQSSVVIIVNPDVEGEGCSFGTPVANPLPTLADVFNGIYVLGTGGPDLSNVFDFTINWELNTNGLFQFSMQTTNGVPAYWIDLMEVSTHTFGSSQPGVTFSGSNIPGLDGNYYVNLIGEDLVLASVSGAYAIYFTNSGSAPSCNELRSVSIQNSEVEVRAFPNPFKREISVSMNTSAEYLTVTLFNQVGVELKTLRMRNNDLMRLERDLPDGIYFLSVRSSSASKMIRLIKK